MTGKRAAEHLEENLTALYSYAFSRLYDKSKVEDLVSEIIYEIITSAGKLKEDEAFWGFAWKIADHTFRRFIRRAELMNRTVEFTEDYGSVYDLSPEQEYVEKETESEEIYLLRRELSLLSKNYREVCVAYYVDQKSCSEIAAEKNISMEMVKYYLFKTRKLLKEGISMTRELGEKSYNPGKFLLSFWGDRNHYWDLFKRKLPGSITLAAYEKPVSAEELSMELGVSMPYLEEEIEILEAAGILKKEGKKYQTNLVIITEAYEKELLKKTAHLYAATAKKIFDETVLLLPKIREFNFHGRDYDNNRLLFGLLNLVMVEGYNLSKEKSPYGNAKQLALGGQGFLFGYDYYKPRFMGVTVENWNKEGTAWFSAENYCVIRDSQFFDHSGFDHKTAAMCDAILSKDADRENPALPWLIEHNFIFCDKGKLSPNFLVFDKADFDQIRRLLKSSAENVADCMIEISDQAGKLLMQYAPASVKEQCCDIAKIRRLDVAALLLENLVAEQKLTVPKEEMPLCVWGVKA